MMAIPPVNIFLAWDTTENYRPRIVMKDLRCFIEKYSNEEEEYDPYLGFYNDEEPKEVICRSMSNDLEFSWFLKRMDFVSIKVEVNAIFYLTMKSYKKNVFYFGEQSMEFVNPIFEIRGLIKNLGKHSCDFILKNTSEKWEFRNLFLRD